MLVSKVGSFQVKHRPLKAVCKPCGACLKRWETEALSIPKSTASKRQIGQALADTRFLKTLRGKCTLTGYMCCVGGSAIRSHKAQSPTIENGFEGQIHMGTARFHKAAPEEVAGVFGRHHTKRDLLLMPWRIINPNFLYYVFIIKVP